MQSSRCHHRQLAVVVFAFSERSPRCLVQPARRRLHFSREGSFRLGGGVAAGAGFPRRRLGRLSNNLFDWRWWRWYISVHPRGWRWGRQSRATRAAPVVEGGEVCHADGQTIGYFEGLSEARAMRGVTSRLGAHVELGGERESARGAGRAALSTGRCDEAGRAAGGRAVRYFGRAAHCRRGRPPRPLAVAAVFAEVLGRQMGAWCWNTCWRWGRRR